MSGIFEEGTYLPDRSPTWSEVLVFIFGLIVIGLQRQLHSPLSLPAVALGFVGAAILLGPIAQTQVRKRINEWETETRFLARLGAIIWVLIGGIVTLRFEAIPTERITDLLKSVLFGVLLFYLLVLAAHLLYKRQITGWIPESS